MSNYSYNEIIISDGSGNKVTKSKKEVLKKPRKIRKALYLCLSLKT